MAEEGIDPIVAGSALVQALQTITSRNIAAADAAVVSVTQFHGGEAWNVIPAKVVLRGSLRYFRDEVRHTIHGRLQSLCAGVAAAHGARAELRILPGYPLTVNSAAEAATAAAAMAAVVGAERVDTHLPPTMGAEDFAYMLQARPGAYGWIGNGPGTGGCLLHNPRYDFNDALLAIGASYWATSSGTPKPAGFRSPAEPCKPTAPAKHHRAPAATGSPRQDGQHLRRCRRSGPSPRCAARAVPENRAPGWG